MHKALESDWRNRKTEHGGRRNPENLKNLTVVRGINTVDLSDDKDLTTPGNVVEDRTQNPQLDEIQTIIGEEMSVTSLKVQAIGRVHVRKRP